VDFDIWLLSQISLTTVEKLLWKPDMAIASCKSAYDEVEHRDLSFGDAPWVTYWMNTMLAAVPDGGR
jgi:hypothetical protein